MRCGCAVADSALVCIGESLAAYGFGPDHPFGTDRLQAFWSAARQCGLDQRVRILSPQQAVESDLLRFHTQAYVELVRQYSATGEGFLDAGDTPAFRGMFEAAATVAGSVLAAADRIMAGTAAHAFVPIAGLHHARRDAAAGFCVFNDCGILIEYLKQKYGLRRIAYVDIDAHHGDGVFYAFAGDEAVWIVDIHEDGRFLYPGTGFADETGTGAAAGSKLNLPLQPGAGDEDFRRAWAEAERHLQQAQAEFIILQCGADSLAGDPITHLRFSAAAHAYASERLCRLAAEHAHGRLLALGGGGYNRRNLALAWCAVVEQLNIPSAQY